MHTHSNSEAKFSCFKQNLVKFKPVKKQVDKDDGFDADVQNQYNQIVGNPFPASTKHTDMWEVRYRVSQVLSELKENSIRLLCDLMHMSRILGRLEIKDFVNPCTKNTGRSSLIEKFCISDYKSFNNAFASIGITYPSWTEYWKQSGDKFQGMYFIRVSGKGGRPTTFRVNILKAIEIGELIKAVPYGKIVKGSSIFK